MLAAVSPGKDSSAASINAGGCSALHFRLWQPRAQAGRSPASLGILAALLPDGHVMTGDPGLGPS